MQQRNGTTMKPNMGKVNWAVEAVFRGTFPALPEALAHVKGRQIELDMAKDVMAQRLARIASQRRHPAGAQR